MIEQPPVTNIELFFLTLPLIIIAVVGSYWVIRYNDQLPYPEEEEEDANVLD